jgi:hypothetical protein
MRHRTRAARSWAALPRRLSQRRGSSRAQGAPTLKFRTIPDPDGWAESLRLKGDWLIFEISDGVLSRFRRGVA